MREGLRVLLEVHYDTAWAQVFVTLLPSLGVETACPCLFLHVHVHVVTCCEPSQFSGHPPRRGITVPCLEVKVAQAEWLGADRFCHAPGRTPQPSLEAQPSWWLDRAGFSEEGPFSALRLSEQLHRLFSQSRKPSLTSHLPIDTWFSFPQMSDPTPVQAQGPFPHDQQAPGGRCPEHAHRLGPGASWEGSGAQARTAGHTLRRGHPGPARSQGCSQPGHRWCRSPTSIRAKQPPERSDVTSSKKPQRPSPPLQT